MADNARGPVLFRPRFLTFCLYVMCYLTLRGYGEIEYRAVVKQNGNLMVQTALVGAAPGIPRWRKQLYRVVFSPLMVAEEEGRRLADKGGGLFEDAGEYGRSLLPN